MKKILLIGVAVFAILLSSCKHNSKVVPFKGDYSVRMDLSYLDSSSAYMQMYVLLAAMVDSSNSGDLIPYKISFSDTALQSYYSDNQTFSYSYTYKQVDKNYYQLVLDKKDTVGLELRDTAMLMLFPDDMAFLLTKIK